MLSQDMALTVLLTRFGPRPLAGSRALSLHLPFLARHRDRGPARGTGLRRFHPCAPAGKKRLAHGGLAARRGSNLAYRGGGTPPAQPHEEKVISAGTGLPQ